MNYSASELAHIFALKDGYKGARTTVADISRHGIPGACVTKRHALSLIRRAEDWRQSSDGAGNRARRRALAQAEAEIKDLAAHV